MQDDDGHPWWWRHHAPLKRRSTIILHGNTSQKAFWTSYSPPRELEISYVTILFSTVFQFNEGPALSQYCFIYPCCLSDIKLLPSSYNINNNNNNMGINFLHVVHHSTYFTHVSKMNVLMLLIQSRRKIWSASSYSSDSIYMTNLILTIKLLQISFIYLIIFILMLPFIV
jgi:hypothetical protein